MTRIPMPDWFYKLSAAEKFVAINLLEMDAEIEVDVERNEHGDCISAKLVMP